MSPFASEAEAQPERPWVRMLQLLLQFWHRQEGQGGSRPQAACHHPVLQEAEAVGALPICFAMHIFVRHILSHTLQLEYVPCNWEPVAAQPHSPPALAPPLGALGVKPPGAPMS
jgi:hypothetical protein